ncbi:MAG: TrkA family potassium uptake protein [bacterium]|nr:TrkA family potassium uptake protein [bacterium]
MGRHIQIGIIGLGKFGLALGEALMKQGAEVVGVDAHPAMVKRAQDVLTQVYQADATDETALKQLGLADMTYVVIGVGQQMEASTLIALHLKELGAPQVWVKAVSEDHEKILYKIGVDFVVFPEREAAEQIAHRLTVPGLIDMLPFWHGVVLQQLTIDEWEGKTLREIDMTNKYHVQAVAIGNQGDKDLSFVPNANKPLARGDVLIVIGKEDDISKIKS